MTCRDLFLRIRALVAPHRVERELDEELAFHIERETQKQIADGLSPVAARRRAIARFGPVPAVADRCRDARGTAFLDGLARDVLYAFRTFRRAPLAALTIVGTISLGLGLVAAVFTYYSVFFLRVDAVQNPGELFAVLRPTAPGGDERMPFTRAEYEALRRETSVFTDAVAMVRSIETRIEGRPMSSTLVTGNFFQVLGVQAALGRTLTPHDDEPAAGRPIVLSHRGWIKLFGGDSTVIGRSLSVNGVPCEVAGVMPEAFRGLGVAPPDYWAPLALARELRPTYEGREHEMAVDDVVGRLKPGVSSEQAAAGLAVWASGRASLNAAGDRPVMITLAPRQGTLSADWLEVLAVSSPVFFAFGLILMIGCANIANLLLARAVARQREIGIRLSLGASRRRISRQLLTESLILALMSAACGFAVSRIFLEGAVYAATVTMPGEIAEQVHIGVPSADWRMLVFLMSGALVSTVFFGLAPAVQATRVALVRAMRGEVTRDARPNRARHALIAVQVGASALLLICAAVFLRSALAAADADPGIRTSDTIRLPIANEPRREAIVRDVTAHPLVVAVAAMSPDRLAEASVLAEAAADRQADDSAATRRSLPVDYRFVSPEYFQLFEIPLIRGRGFTDAERAADSGVTVVSESIARRLWPNGDAVGQVVRIQADDPTEVPRPSASLHPSRAYTVVGVARDVDGRAMFQFFSFSGVYLPIDLQSPGTSLMLRVRGDVEQARLALLDRLTRVDPALDHEVQTLRTVAGLGAYILQIAFWVTVGLGGLALVLTVSGLFSVLSYLVEQRAKEIGVRMALGATTGSIAVLVLLESVRPVGFGLLAGGGLAAGLAIVLMSTPAASEIGDIVHVLDPVAYAASLLVIVTACVLAASVPALRAARLDPIATLRND
jgi:predicted permease